MSTYSVEDICCDTLWLQIIQWIAIGIGLMSTVCVGINGHKNLKTKPIPFTYKYMFYSCNILGAIQILLFSTTISICNSNISNSGLWSYITAVLSFIIYAIIIGHLFVSWLLRLYLTFNGSIYAKSNTFYITISIIFIFITLFAIIGFILYNVSIKFIGSTLVIISGFMYFFVSIWILQVFNRQLLKLITARIVTMRCKTKESLQKRTSTIDLSFEDQELVHCMGKYFVLGITSFSTTLLVLISMLFQFLNVLPILHVLQILIVVDIITNVLCIYLQFMFAHPTFMMLCSYFDAKINKQIERKAVHKLRGDTFAFYAKKFAPTVHKQSTKEIGINIEIAEMPHMSNVQALNSHSMVSPSALDNGTGPDIDFDKLIDFNKLNSKTIHEQIEKRSSQIKKTNRSKHHQNINESNTVMSDSDDATP